MKRNWAGSEDSAIYEAADSKEAEVRIAAWRAFKLITAYQPSHPCCKDIAECVMETTVEGDITMTFLQYRVLNNLGYDTELQQKALLRPRCGFRHFPR